MTVTCLVFYESAQLFSRVPTPFLIPLNNVYGASQVEVLKKTPANVGDTESISGLRRSRGGGNGNPLQYTFLENPMNRGAWHATVHGVAKSQT